MNTPSFYSEPQVQYLSTLIEEIGRGFLQVPRFQRPLIWDLDRQLELLRSIRDGIPIGAVMIWRTSDTSLPFHEHLGPYRLPAPPQGSPRQYVLDGVQRLSTLYGALHFPSPERILRSYDDESNVYDFYFDFVENDFVGQIVPQPAQLALFSDGDGTGHRLPLRHLFETVQLVEFQRQLAAKDTTDWIKVSDQLARAFRNYKVAVIPITTNDLNLATRTFQLINSQGAAMSEFDMIHALTYSADFHLTPRMNKLRKDHLGPVGWRDFDRDWILRACKAALDQHMYKVEASRFSVALKAQPAILEQTMRCIRHAVDFLRERCGVWTPELLPHDGQVIMMAEVFRQYPAPARSLEDLLEAWFWLSSYGRLFSGMSGERVQFTLQAVRAMATEGILYWSDHRPFEYQTLPERFRWGAVRAKALVLRLDGQQKKLGLTVLARHGKDGIDKLIPRERLPQNAPLFSSPGNVVVVAPEQLDSMRKALLSPDGQVDPALLEAHCIERDSFEALRAGDFATFIENRQADLNRLEKEHVEAICTRFRFERYPSSDLGS